MRKLSIYILKEFLFFLGYSLLAFLMIFILVDVVDHVDQFIDRDFGLPVILLYYVFCFTISPGFTHSKR